MVGLNLQLVGRGCQDCHLEVSDQPVARLYYQYPAARTGHSDVLRDSSQTMLRYPARLSEVRPQLQGLVQAD